MPIPEITLTEEQARDLVEKRDKEIADIVNSGKGPQAMIDLQKLIDKRNQAYQHLTTMLQKQQEAIKGTVQNMR